MPRWKELAFDLYFLVDFYKASHLLMVSIVTSGLIFFFFIFMISPSPINIDTLAKKSKANSLPAIWVLFIHCREKLGGVSSTMI